MLKKYLHKEVLWGVLYVKKDQKKVKKFIQINPESDEGYNILGIVLTNLKKFEEAKEVLKHALKINPKNEYWNKWKNKGANTSWYSFFRTYFC